MSFEVCKLSIAEIKKLLFFSHDESRQEIVNLLKQDKRAGVQKLVASLEACLKKGNQLEQEFIQLSSFEQKLRRKGFSSIAGVDEAGRGAFAGPLVAAVVVLPNNFFLPGLRECKQLLPEAREKLYKKIVENACDWHVETVISSYIDEVGLHKANLLALEHAVLNLSKIPDYVLSDGFALPNLKLPHIALIGGDKLSISIAAASIIAKVERDRLMVSYSKKFPAYGFDHNKGYGTKEHLEALEKFGPSPIHRLCFKPVRNCVELKLGDF
jgi:ribonuclease HII